MKDTAKRIPGGSWEELPTIKLKNQLEKESWFTGRGTITHTYDKALWEATPQRDCIIPSLSITLPFGKYQIAISVTWTEFEYHRRSARPRRQAFKISNATAISMVLPIKNSTSSTYSGAISRIMSIVQQVIPPIKTRIEQDKETERQLEHRNTEIIKLAKELGVQLQKIEYRNSIIYKPTDSFMLEIVIYTKIGEETTYAIDSIHGKFTIDEIREIAKIVGTNPRAIAERMCKH